LAVFLVVHAIVVEDAKWRRCVMSAWALCYTGSTVLFWALVIRLSPKTLAHKLANLMGLIYLVGMVFGAHMLYYLVVERSITNTVLANAYADLLGQRGTLASAAGLADLALLFRSTLAGFWGGPLCVLTGLLLCQVLLRLPEEEKHRSLDVFAVSFPFALALAKLGCFLVGCCHGIESAGPFAIRFTWVSEHSGCYMRRCFPTQLLDLAIYLFVGIALLVAFTRSRQKGRLILWFVLLYGVGRFLSEFTRGDDIGGQLLGLSPVQIVLLLACGLGVLLMLRPRWYERILAVRIPVPKASAQRRAVSEERRRLVAQLDNTMPWLSLATLFACFLILPAAPLALLGVLFAVRLRRAQLAGDDAVAWTRAGNALAYLAVEVCFVAAFLLPSVLALMVSLTVLTAVGVAVLNRTYGLVPLGT
jgi:prolipoprotein diacylglyceryltransferase